MLDSYIKLYRKVYTNLCVVSRSMYGVWDYLTPHPQRFLGTDSPGLPQGLAH